VEKCKTEDDCLEYFAAVKWTDTYCC